MINCFWNPISVGYIRLSWLVLWCYLGYVFDGTMSQTPTNYAFSHMFGLVGLPSESATSCHHLRRPSFAPFPGCAPSPADVWSIPSPPAAPAAAKWTTLAMAKGHEVRDSTAPAVVGSEAFWNTEAVGQKGKSGTWQMASVTLGFFCEGR